MFHFLDCSGFWPDNIQFCSKYFQKKCKLSYACLLLRLDLRSGENKNFKDGLVFYSIIQISCKMNKWLGVFHYETLAQNVITWQTYASIYGEYKPGWIFLVMRSPHTNAHLIRHLSRFHEWAAWHNTSLVAITDIVDVSNRCP